MSRASSALAAYWLLVFAVDAAIAEDRPAAAAKAVAGRVVDQQGQAVRGVKVSSRVDGKRGPESLTDAEGAFELALPAKAIQGLALSAEHSDFVRGYLFLSAADLQAALKSPETMTIPLDPGTVIGGFIRDEEGGPIENARVKLSLSDGEHGHDLDVKTDAEGRWRAHVPTGMRADRFLLYHTDYVCVTISYYLPPEEPLHAEQAVTVMKHGRSVRGKVHDAQGKPVANALVLTQSSSDMSNPDDDATTTRTQDDGTFAIRNMPAGPGAVAVYADSYAPTRVAVDVGDATPAVDVELLPAGELNGQIVDDRGEGVPEVWIYLLAWQPEPSFPLELETNTDGEGRFHLGPLPREGWFEFNYQKNGFLSMTCNDMRAQSEPCILTIMRPTTIHGQVLDDETGEPIKNFTVVKGTRWSRTDDMVFDHTHDRRNVAVRADDGRFSVALDHTSVIPPNPQVAVRVVARGYLPAETEPVAAGKQPPAVTLRLKRAEPMAGLVVDPAGQPVAYAQVAWVGPKRTAFIENGRFMKSLLYRPEIVVETGTDGRFELPASRHDGLIVVLHEKGYLQRRRGEHGAESPLRLTPWGRVEGSALAGSAPIANASVSLRHPNARPPEPQNEVTWSFQQQTHVDGSFAFDYVPSIPLTAVCYLARLSSHKTPVTPKPGETVRIEIGGHGGAVTGRLEKPGGLRLDTFTDEFEVGINCTQVVAYPAAQADERQDDRENYGALLNSDGTFTIHDLPPGAYRLEANVHAAVPANSCGLPVSLATARTEFRIGGGSDGEGGGVALQLPTLKLKLVPGPQVGQMAPELRGKTLSGEEFDLADLRGKPVLLDFWGTWCGPCKAATPAVKHLYETYGRDGRMAFVGVDLDYGVEAAANYVEQEGLAWPQVATGSWGEENAVLRTFAVTSAPSFWLIGADGTILARDIPLVDLDRQVQAALTKTNARPAVPISQ